MLVAGTVLLLFVLFLKLFKSIKASINLEKFEAFSRYVVQAPIWFLLSLLLVELTLRVTIYNPPLKVAVTNWAGDVPGVQTLILWGKEGYGISWYDKWGALQTPYHDNDKENNVIILGDSQTECLQVSNDLKFVSVAETHLRRDGYNADLHNLGRSGLAMADYVSWLPPFRSIFRPKVIVVQLTTKDFTESFDEGQFNNFVVKDDLSLDLVHVYDFSGNFVQKARKKYRLDYQIEELGKQRWYFMQASFDKAKNDAASISIGPVNEAQNNVTDGTSSPQTVNLQASPAKAPATQVLDTSVFNPLLADQQMKLLLDASEGVPLIVVLLPYAPYISGDGIDVNDPTHEQLLEFMKRYPEVTVVDPLPAFQELASNGHLPRGFFNSTPGGGHLNKVGNQIVGQLLAQAIGQVLK